MPIVLFRVDERLIHGQVVIGWGHALRPDRFLVVDDDLVRSTWEQDLYRLAAVDAKVEFTSCAEAASSLGEWREASERSILLTRDIRTMLCLAAGGRLNGAKVNLGGLHHGPGREEVLTYLHLSQEDRDDLRALAEEGADVSAQDLPDARRVALATLLGDRGSGD